MDQARKVRVCITNEQNPNDSKSSMHFLKWIQLDGGDVIYEFPPEFQQLNSKHRTLLQIPTVKSVLKTLTRRGSYRIIAITLPATTVPLYFDDNGNSVFEEYYLEEKDLQKMEIGNLPCPNWARAQPTVIRSTECRNSRDSSEINCDDRRTATATNG
ncbi:unnamed protein product, partial [Nesidiocoris tenuis]